MIKTKSLKSYLRESFKSLRPFSDKYESDFDRYLHSLNVLSKIPNFKEKRILDLGTGVGILPLALKKMGFNAYGLDYYIFSRLADGRFAVENMSDLKNIWSKHDLTVHNVPILDKDFTAQQGKFDILICEAVIEHLKDPKVFLEWCGGLLNNGGYILITTPNIATLTKRIRFFLGKTPMWPIEDFYESGDSFTGHWREYTMNELDYMVNKSGFDVVSKNTKNVLAKFKKPTRVKKNLVALITLLSFPFSNTREVHYVLCRKNE